MVPNVGGVSSSALMILMFFALRGSRVQPVSLSNWHSDQLASANDYGIKNLTFCIRQSPDKAVSFRMVINNCSHLGKNPRINAVSLRQISHRTGKVTSLPGVNYGDLKTFGLKRTGYGGLPSTQKAISCCLSSAMMKSKPSAPLFNSVAGGNIQRCFGHIGIDTKWIWQTHYCPFLLMRYGVRTTVRVSDEWLSVCAICLHTGLNPKGHQAAYVLPNLFSAHDNEEPGYKVEEYPQRSGA